MKMGFDLDLDGSVSEVRESSHLKKKKTSRVKIKNEEPHQMEVSESRRGVILREEELEVREICGEEPVEGDSCININDINHI